MEQITDSRPEITVDIDHEVIDCDAHIFESEADLAPYIEDPEAKRYVEAPNQRIPRDGWDRTAGGRIGRPANGTPDDEAQKMKDLSVDISILSPTLNLYNGLVGDQSLSNALARAYNDYMLDVWLDTTDVFKSGILVPVNDPEFAAEEIDRVGDEDGFVSVMVNPVGPRMALGDTRYDPIYREAERRGLPIYLHGGATTHPTFPLQTDYFHKFLEVHAISHTFQQISQVTSLLCRGVPERFPKLDFVSVEAGLSWIPYFYRLDTEYLSRRNEAPELEKKPSAYFRESFFVSTQPMEEYLTEDIVPHLVELAGGWDSLLFSTDWPHWDFDSPEVVRENFPPEHHSRIYHENAREVFAL